MTRHYQINICDMAGCVRQSCHGIGMNAVDAFENSIRYGNIMPVPGVWTAIAMEDAYNAPAIKFEIVWPD